MTLENNLPIKLKVSKLDQPDLAITNTIYVNKDDFTNSTNLILVNNSIVYPCKHYDNVKSGTILLNKAMRSAINVNDVNSIVSIIEYKPIKYNNDKIVLDMYVFKLDNKEYYTLHETVIIDYIKQTLKTHYFYRGQHLLIKFDDTVYLFKVEKGTGFINGSTNIQLITHDNKLSIVGNKLLRKELFDPNYSFEKELGIGGMDSKLLTILKQALSTRAINENIIKTLGIKHVKGVLLHGPPGTGKTLIARKLSKILTIKPPKIVNGPEILNKYVGQSEENVRKIFEEALIEAKEKKEKSDLHVIIIDEIDAIVKRRGRDSVGVNDNIVNQFLTLIDGFDEINNIFIIAMTNRKDLLDPALLRSGRIELHVNIGLPTKEGREQILRIHTERLRLGNMIDKDVDFNKIVEITENFSGAEIEALVRKAISIVSYEILAKNTNDSETMINITNEHFISAYNDMSPTFGKVNTSYSNLLPINYLSLFCQRATINKINILLSNEYRLKTVLLYGVNGSGKSVIQTLLAINSKSKYVKLMRASDVLSLNDTAKINYLTDVLNDANISGDAMLIIDDIEIMLNYADINNVVGYSNNIYQTILTLLKSIPDNKNNRLSIIISCHDNALKKAISKNFDNIIEVDKPYDQDACILTNNKLESADSLTIRELINGN